MLVESNSSLQGSRCWRRNPRVANSAMPIDPDTMAQAGPFGDEEMTPKGGFMLSSSLTLQFPASASRDGSNLTLSYTLAARIGVFVRHDPDSHELEFALLLFLGVIPIGYWLFQIGWAVIGIGWKDPAGREPGRRAQHL